MTEWPIHKFIGCQPIICCVPHLLQTLVTCVPIASTPWRSIEFRSQGTRVTYVTLRCFMASSDHTNIDLYVYCYYCFINLSPCGSESLADCSIWLQKYFITCKCITSTILHNVIKDEKCFTFNHQSWTLSPCFQDEENNFTGWFGIIYFKKELY